MPSLWITLSVSFQQWNNTPITFPSSFPGSSSASILSLPISGNTIFSPLPPATSLEQSQVFPATNLTSQFLPLRYPLSEVPVSVLLAERPVSPSVFWTVLACCLAALCAGHTRLYAAGPAQRQRLHSGWWIDGERWSRLSSLLSGWKGQEIKQEKHRLLGVKTKTTILHKWMQLQRQRQRSLPSIRRSKASWTRYSFSASNALRKRWLFRIFKMT